jgi:hypothetical protein
VLQTPNFNLAGVVWLGWLGFAWFPINRIPSKTKLEIKREGPILIGLFNLVFVYV